MAEHFFARTGVDPVSRCERCGAAVAAEGQEDHRVHHQHLTLLARELEELRRGPSRTDPRI